MHRSWIETHFLTSVVCVFWLETTAQRRLAALMNDKWMTCCSAVTYDCFKFWQRWDALRHNGEHTSHFHSGTGTLEAKRRINSFLLFAKSLNISVFAATKHQLFEYLNEKSKPIPERTKRPQNVFREILQESWSHFFMFFTLSTLVAQVSQFSWNQWQCGISVAATHREAIDLPHLQLKLRSSPESIAGYTPSHTFCKLVTQSEEFPKWSAKSPSWYLPSFLVSFALFSCFSGWKLGALSVFCCQFCRRKKFS